MRGLSRGARCAAAATIIAVGLAGCGGGSSDEPAAGASSGVGGVVTISGSEPQNPLVPVNTNETGGGDVIDAMTTGLVNYDPTDAHPINAIAESIDTTDNTTFTVKLKKGWKFHDGTEVTSKSFVDAWNWGAYGPNAALNSYFFGSIEGFADVQGEDKNGDEAITADEATAETMSGLTVVDPTTFTVKLSSPASDFVVSLGYSAFVPLPESFFADPKAFGAKPVGNGPFKFVSWTHNSAIKLTAFDGYQGPDKPKVKDVTFKIYQSQDAAYADLLGGNLDIMAVLPSAALAGDVFKEDLGDRAVEQPTGTFQSIAFPPEKTDPSLNNPKLRQALSMAIDREAIVKSIFNNARVPATGWVSPVVTGYKAGACGEFCTFDPAKAKALFKEAGGYEGTLTLSYNADGDHKAHSEAECNSISKTLGIKCQAKPVVDFATFRTQISEEKMKGLFRTGWQMDYPSIQNFLGPLYATGAGSNDSRYSNAAFDAKLKEAAGAPADGANVLYQEAEAMLAADLPVIPLWYGKLQAGYGKNIKSVKFTPFGTPALETISK
jgi:oligopeptide transport system substrate-binding protein